MVRRDPLTRLLAWLYTGPLGHLYATVVDVCELWLRWGFARLRGAPRT